MLCNVKNKINALKPLNQEKLENRLLKEAIHELGHTFGLRHCLNFDCVMHSSTYIEEFDFKTENFCKKCKSEFEISIGD